MLTPPSDKTKPPHYKQTAAAIPENTGPDADIWDDRGEFDSAKAESIYSEARSWPPEQKAAMLGYLRSARTRSEIKSKYANAAELAHSVDPTFKITRALNEIATSIEQVLTRPRANLLVTMPPQEGKSSLCSVWTPIRALQLNPNRRIILATYGDALAESHSMLARDIITRHGTDVVDRVTGLHVTDKLGLKLSSNSNKVSAWKIEGGAGGMVAVGLGSAITGRPADLFIIDDPYKNMMEADSASYRRKVDDWFSSVVLTRLSPEASIILIQCMTGDTPVLRPDGTETPIRDIRPGDQVATYEGGNLNTSTVLNWANQGPDDVLCIRMKSGRTVRANARHPFLVSEGGQEVWRRAAEITSGDRLVALSAEPGKRGHPALSMGAMSPLRAKACAGLTTTRNAGLTGFDTPPIAGDLAAVSSCESDTESTTTNMTCCSPRKMVDAPSADGYRGRKSIFPSTGTGICASTTATTVEPFEVYSAMTATLPLVDSEMPRLHDAPLPIWSEDEVVGVVPCGTEDVFDIQVERTENFIANGLVSHNTRWHPEDLSGKVIAGESEVPPEEKSWRHINIPAISEAGIPDALGREPDVVMDSARGRTRREFDQTRRQVGERVWYALYQGSPRIPSGGLFLRSWFEPRVESPPEMPIATVVAIDPADSGEGDETGIIAGMLDQSGTVVLCEDWSGAMTADAWSRRAVVLALTLGAREIALEAYAAGTTYTLVLKQAWKKLHDEAVAKHSTGQPLAPSEQRALASHMPFTIFGWRGKGDAVGRSSLLRQALETKKCRVVDYKLGVFECQAADWQVGQHQPDRVAAAIIAHDRLAALGSGQMSMSAPVTGRPADAPAWLRRRVSDRRG